MKTIIEPFRIKAVEPIRMTTLGERKHFIERAHYNLFLLDAEDVLIDLLTDSGTSSMSTAQWAGIMRGDESYAGSPSYARFEAAVRHLMPFRYVIPTHQGRAAERILFSVAVNPGQFVPNNGHFDTTRANVEAQGASAVDLTCEEGLHPELEHPFKGNMDVARLETFIAEKGVENVPLCMLTITNNAVGGQPVSMENIRQTREVCHRHGVPLLFDACRFAENAYFIKLREPGYEDMPIVDIVHEMFSYADGCTMSAKKDAFANIGGWLSLNDDAWATECRNVLIVTEGFPTYGGMAGRDLEAIAVGLEEIVQEEYLEYRVACARYVERGLAEAGVPMIHPVGAHAIYLDAKAFLPHIPPHEYPGQSLAVELYVRGGIRSCEIGTVMFGQQSDGSERAVPMELVRLALPRRVYTQSHMDYVLEVLLEVFEHRGLLGGMRIVSAPPSLRHFTAEFAYVDETQ